MNTQTPTIKPTSKLQKKANPNNRFQRLWEEAEDIKRENQQLEAALDKLVLQVRNDLGPIERELGLSVRRQVDKLIVFAGRKSLSQWQHHTLDEWINESTHLLHQMGLVDDDLNNSLAELQAKLCGIEIDNNSERSAAEQLVAGIEEQLADMDEDDVEAHYSGEFEDEEDFMRWFEEDLEEENAEQFTEQDYQHRAALGSEQTAVKQPQTVFKTLFHRVARALHPDKETDPAKREIKQGLMAQLLDARRQHDLMRVFQLYHEHVGTDLDFVEQELRELEVVLVQYIDLETQRQHEITTKSHMHNIVFNEFYDNNPTKVKKAIERKIKEIEQRTKDVEHFSKAVTSLKKLKPYLEERYEKPPWFF